MDKKKYSIAVSYASEQRPYVERFVRRLESLNLHIYYDRNEQAHMVGKILDQELHKIYIQESKHCVLFLSNAYIGKPVTRYESQIILSETIFKDGFMYIFKFDDVTLPGLNRNFVYSSVKEYPEPEQYADFMYEIIQGKKPKCSDLLRRIEDHSFSSTKIAADISVEILKSSCERIKIALKNISFYINEEWDINIQGNIEALDDYKYLGELIVKADLCDGAGCTLYTLKEYREMKLHLSGYDSFDMSCRSIERFLELKRFCKIRIYPTIE